MMSRCYICDYSNQEGMQSDYYRGLKTHASKNRNITLDKKTGHPICSVCQDSISADLFTKKEKAVENA